MSWWMGLVGCWTPCLARCLMRIRCGPRWRSTSGRVAACVGARSPNRVSTRRMICLCYGRRSAPCHGSRRVRGRAASGVAPPGYRAARLASLSCRASLRLRVPRGPMAWRVTRLVPVVMRERVARGTRHELCDSCRSHRDDRPLSAGSRWPLCGEGRIGVQSLRTRHICAAAVVANVARRHSSPAGGGRTRLTDVHITSPFTNVEAVAAADTERVRPCKVAQIKEEANS
jgi:hypothetical protein